MWQELLSFQRSCAVTVLSRSESPRPLTKGGVLNIQGAGYRKGGISSKYEIVGKHHAEVDLALALLVTGVLANHHHTTMTTNDLALVADRFNARIDLHHFSVRGLLVPVHDATSVEVVWR